MLNPMELVDRTIMVTGASSGIGRETAILLSQLGARVVLVGRNRGELETTLSRLEGAGHVVAPFDLTSVDDIPRWMKELVPQSGALHGLVHSAGIQLTKPLRVVSSGDIDQVMTINVSAACGLVRGFRQKGVVAPPGSVVLLSSVSGIAGQPGNSVYSASKGALVALARSLALELAREKIRVNCVAPALVHTEMAEKMREALTPEQFDQIDKMHPLGIGLPRDVAHAIAFLLADTGRWITGTTLVVDGGYTAH